MVRHSPHLNTHQTFAGDWTCRISARDLLLELDAAVAGARRRPIGDAGLWAWDRRDGSVFVAPLVAATLARFGAVTAGRPRSNRAVFV